MCTPCTAQYSRDSYCTGGQTAICSERGDAAADTGILGYEILRLLSFLFLSYTQEGFSNIYSGTICTITSKTELVEGSQRDIFGFLQSWTVKQYFFLFCIISMPTAEAVSLISSLSGCACVPVCVLVFFGT